MFRAISAIIALLSLILAIFHKPILEQTGIDLTNAWKVVESLLVTSNLQTAKELPTIPKERIFTADELSTYKGQEETTPIYLALLGRVFDVSKGREYYRPGKGYHIFAGTDASRAFVTGDFTPTGLSDDVLDLDDQDFGGLAEWLQFYHKDYTYVGKLAGRYFDSEGKLTDYGAQVDVKLQRTRDAKDAEDALAQVYPSCNSEWSQARGGRIWCSKSSGGVERDWEGVPRLYRPPGANAPRCVCVRSIGPPSTSSSVPDTNEGDLRDPHLKEYPNCPPTATSCQIS
nr:EOG090X0A5G [Triops cancriformis]